MKPASLGLRLQLVLALTAAFAAASLLLGFAASRLAERVGDADRMRDASATLRVLASALDAETPAKHRAIREALRGEEFLGLSIRGRGGVEETHGRVDGDESVSESLADGRTATLFLAHRHGTAGARLSNMLLLYTGVTALAILLLTYIVLTRWIVVPLEAVTAASRRLAAGKLDVLVPVAGSREVAELAIAFNAMAQQLRDDRAALEARLRELETTSAHLRSAEEQVVRGEKLASVGRLAAGVAHEIGNPLSAILGLVELVRQGSLPKAEEAEFLERIQRETERIHRIIRDLLDFARQGSASPASDDAVSSLAAIVDDAVRLVTPQKDVRAIRIERDVDAALRVRGSSDRLTQVLLNLLLNAVDAMHGDGVISIHARVLDSGVVLTVKDTGPGISDAILTRLFEPFASSKPAGEGTGLGLAVSHSIVESLGGTLRGANSSEGGAVFTLTLQQAQ